MSSSILFQGVKEHRDGYFVEYAPANPGNRFANLTLTFLHNREPADIASLMHEESLAWVQRYAVPLMTSAFDSLGTLVHLAGVHDCDHLFTLPAGDKVATHWKMLEDSEFPDGPLKEDAALGIYRDIEFSTLEEREAKATSYAKQLRLGIFIIAMWGLVVSIAVALIGVVLGVATTVFSVFKAVHEAAKSLGYAKRSTRDKQRSDEERKMRHHHDHCERNPEGFLRLKVENLEQDIRDEIQQEGGA